MLPDDKNQVVYLYRSSSFSMKVISEMTGISKTKVHDILHEADSEDRQIFLCHDLRLRLHKEGIPLRDYADVMRAKNIFSNEAINSRNVLAITREVSNLCFRMGLDIQTLVSLFGNFSQFVYSMADKFQENFGTAARIRIELLGNEGERSGYDAGKMRTIICFNRFD